MTLSEFSLLKRIAQHRFYYLQETKRNLRAQLKVTRRQLNQLLKK